MMKAKESLSSKRLLLAVKVIVVLMKSLTPGWVVYGKLRHAEPPERKMFPRSCIRGNFLDSSGKTN
jgi:hypothetical protein